MEENNTAPTEAPIAPASENNQPTTNPEPVKAVPETPTAPKAEIPEDQIEAFNRFVNSNGGFEAAFSKLKKDITAPATKVAEPEQAPKAEPSTAQPSPEPFKVPDGYLSPNDIAALQYRNMLASDEKYSQIKDYIEKGTYVDDMRSMGMTPIDANGNMNHAVIQKFLDLKAKTVPATAPSMPISTTPTVDYVQVGDEISSIEDARKVIAQNMTLGNMAEHPMTTKAKEYIKQYYSNKKK